MKRVGHLFEQVTDFTTLFECARRAARGKRSRPEVATFLIDLETQALALQRDLRAGTYRPGPYRTFWVQDPKPRTISAAPFRDRVVHHAVCAVLEPLLERYSIFHSYACRKGKGTSAAVRRAQQITRRHAYFLKLDVRRFYETADHRVMQALLRRRIKDRALLDLLDVIIEAGAPGSVRNQGLPIGNLTSQHLANLYLGPFDHHMTSRLGVRGYCRYMDDILIGGPDRRTVRRWHDAAAEFLSSQLRLDLREEVTHLAPVAVGVPFLGFRIWPNQIRFDGRRKRRLISRLRTNDRRLRTKEIDEAHAARCGGSLVAWAETADTVRLRRSIVARLDAEERA